MNWVQELTSNLTSEVTGHTLDNILTQDARQVVTMVFVFRTVWLFLFDSLPKMYYSYFTL